MDTKKVELEKNLLHHDILQADKICKALKGQMNSQPRFCPLNTRLQLHVGTVVCDVVFTIRQSGCSSGADQQVLLCPALRTATEDHWSLS